MRADIRELVRKLLSSKKAMTAAAALGIIGMLMILFSGGDKNENTVQTQDVPESASWSDYSTQTEERLVSVLPPKFLRITIVMKTTAMIMTAAAIAVRATTK